MTVPSSDFEGKTVAISGAAGGLGGAFAAYFHRAGARLVLIDRDTEGLSRTLSESGITHARTLVCDQSCDDDIARSCEAAGTVDIFINNAGITHRAPLLETTPADIRRVLEVNLTGAITMAIGMARPMVKRGQGIIINISSQFSLIPAPGRAVYGASKAALTHFTRSAAQEWGPAGVTVVGLAPGPVDTPMLDGLHKNPQAMQKILGAVPTGRLSRPDEMAAAAGFLARCAPGAIQGQTWVMDGGFILRDSIGTF